jgi:hypothetical protein
LDAPKADFDALSIEIDSPSIEIDALRNKIDSLRIEFDSSRNKIGSLRIEIDSLGNKIGSLRNKLDALRNKIGSLRIETGNFKININRSERDTKTKKYMAANKVYSTNYFNAFICIADDCSEKQGEIPPLNDKAKTVARLQYEILNENPYRFTSDEVLFSVYAERNGLNEGELQEQRQLFFSKGQPCFRSSPLTKRYGWGIHSNHEGKIALFGCETPEYKKLSEDESVKVIKAMKTNK